MSVGPLGELESSGGIEGLLTRIDRYVALEQGLFAELGARAGAVTDASAAGMLATHSRQHAWHAELWSERRPVLTSTRPDPVVDGGTAMAPVLQVLSQAASTPVVAAGVYRVVLPRLIVAYEREVRIARLGVDGPTERVASLALFDLVEQWKAGEQYVESTLGRAVTPDALWRFASRLEATVVHSGGW